MTTNSTTSADQASAVQVTEYRPGIVLMTIDMPNKGANILSESMFAQLDQAITGLLDRDDLSGLILFSAKPKIFVAGADLVAISENLDWPDEQIVTFCDEGRAVMAKFSQTPFPTVAAIHGACVGGGLELTLWCDRRIVTDDRRTILGLPEAKLGLVPGWGGTVRVARIAAARGKDDSIEHQIDLVTSGKVINGAASTEIGLADQLVSHDHLLESAAEMIESEFESGQYLADRESIANPLDQKVDVESRVAEFSRRIGANKEIYPFAPTVALEHMLRAAHLPMKEACDSESIAMAQVWGSPASYGLINYFFLGEHNKKNPGFVDPSISPREIVEVGIVGAGVMGRAIALSHLKRRKRVILFDSDSDLTNKVVDELAESFETISVAANCTDFQNCDLVIESVTEKAEVKIAVLKQIETAIAKDAIIASNTSAISISALAQKLDRPDRFCGIHFCHPDAMQLVEVVIGEQTSKQTIATAVGYVKSLGKMPLVVHDRAGFVVNRLLSALLKQAFRLFTNGHSIEAIDNAMREFGFRAGPFEMVDIIGADTCLFAGRAMWEAGLSCVSDSLILPRMVKLGWLGRKVNKGFYLHSAATDVGQVDPESEAELGAYVSDDTNSELSVDQIVNEILSAVVLEAVKILDEKIAANFRDIDLSVIHGFSFPPEHGGLLFWADQFGINKVVNQLIELSQVDPQLTPNKCLVEMSESAAMFYGNGGQ